MLRRLLLLVFVAFAVLGARADARAEAEETCCPCPDDGADDGCCQSLQCACAQSVSVLSPGRVGAPELSPRLVAPSAWGLSMDERPRDRASPPPTRPPIG